MIECVEVTKFVNPHKEVMPRIVNNWQYFYFSAGLRDSRLPFSSNFFILLPKAKKSDLQIVLKISKALFLEKAKLLIHNR